LPDPTTPGIDFSAFLQSEANREAFVMAGKFEALKMTVSDFRYEYQILLSDFLNEYMAILETSKEFPGQTIDPDRVDRLIGEIREFIREQNLDISFWNETF
jgi:hypothetical protein